VYTKVKKSTTAIWWANNDGKVSWCVGPKDKVGQAGMWAYVESMGFGPEEAGTRAWQVYSYNSGAWEEQRGVEVSSLDPAELVSDSAGAGALTPLDCFAERVLEKHVRSRPQSASVPGMARQSASYRELDPEAKGDAESEFYARLMAHVSTLQGARLVRVSGVMLHQNGYSRPYTEVNGEYQRCDQACNGRAVYTHVSMPVAMWWDNIDGKISWCVGPKDKVGQTCIWAYVESMGFGPEEADTRAWQVYSYSSGAWEEQRGVEVSSLDLDGEEASKHRNAPIDLPSARWLFGVGLEIAADNFGIYSVSGLRPLSPADECGLIEVSSRVCLHRCSKTVDNILSAC
jgi:hypothetical protein